MTNLVEFQASPTARAEAGTLTRIHVNSIFDVGDAGLRRFRTDNMTESLIERHYNFLSMAVSSDSDNTQAPRYLKYFANGDNIDSTFMTKILPSNNSSYYLPDEILAGYDQISIQLDILTSMPQGESSVEVAAVESAKIIVRQLKFFGYPPPELAVHGNDAVVMLWSLDDTTFAMTITDGELGYVVRRKRKALKMRDSIQINAYTLSQLSDPRG